VSVHLMPFQLRTKSWSVQRGDKVTLTLLSAEPLKGKPVVMANQPGIKKYQVPRWKITRLSETAFRVVLKTKAAGKPGEMKVRVVGTDIADGTQAKVFTLKLR
jgi:hypothetical protein